jgi:hypothetical protein
VAVVFDPAAPANYSVVGTPGRAHITRGGRRSGFVLNAEFTEVLDHNGE